MADGDGGRTGLSEAWGTATTVLVAFGVALWTIAATTTLRVLIWPAIGLTLLALAFLYLHFASLGGWSPYRRRLLSDATPKAPPLDRTEQPSGFPVQLFPRLDPPPVGREELLAELHACLAGVGPGVSLRRVVLCGLGGVGKTSIAVEYAHRHLGLAELDLVWQFAAEDPALRTQFRNLAAEMGIVDTSFAGDPVRAVHGALAARPGRWLLVFDNAADLEAIWDVLPPAGHGQVLITSQSSQWTGFSVIEVPVLDVQDAAQFLMKRTGDPDQQKAEELAEALGRLPLALEQAAAYMKARDLHVANDPPLARYLRSFRQESLELLGRGSAVAHKEPITTTFSLAFGQIKQTSPPAIGLLRLLACCAPDAIPLDLLLKPPPELIEKLKKSLDPEVAPLLAPLLEYDLAFSDAVAALRQFSLISAPVDGSVSVHRLVQAIILTPPHAQAVPAWQHAAMDLLETAMVHTFDNDLSYQGWYALETSQSQGLIASWIHVLGKLDDRRRAAEALARLYLKAHWWWGWYVPFDFCDQLIELGGEAASPEADDDFRAVVECLRTLHDTYPQSGRFDSPPGAAQARQAWREVDHALRAVACRLEIPVDDAVTAVRHWEPKVGEAEADTARADGLRDIAKFLHAFLAHCERCRYGEVDLGDRSLREIERHYESALAIARRQGDEWNQPWLLYELGDAELDAAGVRRRSPAGYRRTEAACVKKARKCANQAFAMAQKRTAADDAGDEELDFEILSTCERLLGDIDWHVGQREDAAEHLARAVHYAHCFEVWPPHQPDRFTWTFERDQWSRATKPLRELAGQDGGDAALRVVIERIAGFYGSDAVAAREQVTISAEALAAALFRPYRLPPEADLEPRNDSQRSAIDRFRREAKEAIRSVERHHRDLAPLPVQA